MTSQPIDRRQNLLKDCVTELQSCIDYVQKYSNDKEQHLTGLKELAKKYCEIDIQHTRAAAARDETEKHFDNIENDCTDDFHQIYSRYLQEQSSDASYLDHPIWHKINGVIEGEQQGGGENVSEDSEGDLDCDNDDSMLEDCIVPSQFEPPVDPISKKIIENPCRNKKCGHVYEYSTVMDHLKNVKQNKMKARCPYVGCTNNKMGSSFIVEDDALKLQIRNYVANTSNRSKAEASTLNIIL